MYTDKTEMFLKSSQRDNLVSLNPLRYPIFPNQDADIRRTESFAQFIKDKQTGKSMESFAQFIKDKQTSNSTEFKEVKSVKLPANASQVTVFNKYDSKINDVFSTYF